MQLTGLAALHVGQHTHGLVQADSRLVVEAEGARAAQHRPQQQHPPAELAVPQPAEHGGIRFPTGDRLDLGGGQPMTDGWCRPGGDGMRRRACCPEATVSPGAGGGDPDAGGPACDVGAGRRAQTKPVLVTRHVVEQPGVRPVAGLGEVSTQRRGEAGWQRAAGVPDPGRDAMQPFSRSRAGKCGEPVDAESAQVDESVGPGCRIVFHRWDLPPGRCVLQYRSLHDGK